MKQFLMLYEDDPCFAYIISRNVATIKESCISLKVNISESIFSSEDKPLSEFFSFFDAIIDSEYPSLYGKTFHKKYDGLPSDTLLQKIMRETYRIMTVYRNADIHHSNDISAPSDSGEVRVAYKNCKTDFLLRISEKGLKCLKQIVLNSAEFSKHSYSKTYIGHLLFPIYKALTEKHIKEFNDTKGDLEFLDSNIVLSFEKRNVVYDTDYTFENNKIHITNVDESFFCDRASNLDFHVNINDVKYIVPVEAFDEDG